MKRVFYRIATLPTLLHFCLVHGQNIESCATVSSVFAEDSTATVSAELAYKCLQSVPLVKEDATNLLDGWAAFLEWQSDPTYKENPPEVYHYPSYDYLQAVASLRDRVTSGDITTELDLHEGVRDVVFSSNDGHLSFKTDFNGVFYWQRAVRLTSFSSDGQSQPDVWVSSDIQLFLKGDSATAPSPVVSIDGQDTVKFLTSDYSKARQVQDLDAMYNGQFFTIGQPSDSRDGGYFNPVRYPGASTTLTFANGSEVTYANAAGSNRDWIQSVVDGPSFYQHFCNATRKIGAKNEESSNNGNTDLSKRVTHQLLPRQSSSLEPIVETDDGTFAGYFLTGSEEYESVAVIALRDFTTTNQTQIQTLLGQFLATCRTQGVDHLVLDLSSNGGGSIIVAYEIMRQLFPELSPYFMRSFRATEQLDVLGSYYTNLSIAVLEETKGNRTATLATGGLELYDVTGYLDRNADRFPDWSSFYGPVPTHNDQVTHPFTWDVSDTVLTTTYVPTADYFAVTGYGTNVPASPQPFASESIVMLSDGDCASSCSTLSHFLKWQAKVKSLVMGGRPQTGPMQHPGGVKGATVVTMASIARDAITAYRSGLMPEVLLERANQTKLVDLVRYADYLTYRTSDPSDPNLISVNLANSILANEATNGNPDLWADKESVPLQYLHEAADCRMFYTAAQIFSRVEQWTNAADQAFGMTGIERWSGCVEGSFGHASSLSGDSKLFNKGVGVNVTGFGPPNVGDGFVDVSAFDVEAGTGGVGVSESGTSEGTGSQDAETQGTQNGGGRMGEETTAGWVVAVVIGLMALTS